MGVKWHRDLYMCEVRWVMYMQCFATLWHRACCGYNDSIRALMKSKLINTVSSFQWS